MTMKPRNTAAEAQTREGAMLQLMAHGRPSNAIEAQEARGQAELVRSESLPTTGSNDPALAAAGIVFGEPFANDPLFRPATLPQGWAKRPTDHSMWSELVDDKGRKRAGIFYKAAFYDRAAHMHATRRFGYRAEYDEKSHNPTCVVVTDGGATIETFPIAECAVRDPQRPTQDEWRAMSAAKETAEKLAQTWLDKRRPQWSDAAAYWDVE